MGAILLGGFYPHQHATLDRAPELQLAFGMRGHLEQRSAPGRHTWTEVENDGPLIGTLEKWSCWKNVSRHIYVSMNRIRIYIYYVYYNNKLNNIYKYQPIIINQIYLHVLSWFHLFQFLEPKKERTILTRRSTPASFIMFFTCGRQPPQPEDASLASSQTSLTSIRPGGQDHGIQTGQLSCHTCDANTKLMSQVWSE